MPLAQELGFLSVGFVCMTGGIFALIRADLHGPGHRVGGRTAGWILVYLSGFLWLGSLLKGAPILQAIGLALVFAADIAMIYPLQITFREFRARRTEGR